MAEKSYGRKLTRSSFYSVTILLFKTLNQVAAHDQPITGCGYAKGSGYECVVTGSLDKTIKLWDMRQEQPAKVFQVPEVINKKSCENLTFEHSSFFLIIDSKYF